MEENMDMDKVLEEFAALKANQEFVEESMNEMAARFAELDWDLIEESRSSSGISLERLKELDQKISDMLETNPLIKRAAALRHGYIFGEGVRFVNVKPAAQKVIDENERMLFSVMAYEELNKASMSAGNIFVLYNTSTKTFIRVPLQEITGVETDPDSSEIVWHIQRTWESNGKTRRMWYRTDTHKGTKRTTINNVAVSPNHVMFHEKRNSQIGWTWGVPDALAAVAFAIAYSAYLSDNAKLVKSYAQYAYKVTSQTSRGMANAAARISKGAQAGGTALIAAGNELTPVNATGSQVNFNNGQPLAAMVASTLGVSVIALISSPGAAGGSYGAAQTLDKPTVIVMKAIQDMWAKFFRRIFKFLKSNDADVAFPSIDNDPVYRQIASILLAYSQDALHQEEMRGLILDLLDVEEVKPGLPEALSRQSRVVGNDPMPRQGNTGAVPGGVNQGDTNNDGRTDTISSKD